MDFGFPKKTSDEAFFENTKEPTLLLLFGKLTEAIESFQGSRGESFIRCQWTLFQLQLNTAYQVFHYQKIQESSPP